MNLKSLFALIITLFVILLYVWNLDYNESFIEWIVNDDYKIIDRYLFICSALTMIKMIRWIMFESIIFAQEYLNIINQFR